MSQSLDQLVRGMEQSLQGYRRERFSAEEKALAELENQLADLSHDQQQLKRRTEEVRQSASARARQLLRDRAEPPSRRLLPDIQKLRRRPWMSMSIRWVRGAATRWPRLSSDSTTCCECWRRLH